VWQGMQGMRLHLPHSHTGCAALADVLAVVSMYRTHCLHTRLNSGDAQADAATQSQDWLKLLVPSPLVYEKHRGPRLGR